MPVGDPQLDLGRSPRAGRGTGFSIEIGVLPTAKLGDYKGLEVGRRETLSRTRRSSRRSTGYAIAWRDWRPLIVQLPQATSSCRLPRIDRGRAVRRRGGPRPAHRARFGQSDPRLRGGAWGEPRRGGSARSRYLFRPIIRRAAGGRRSLLRGHVKEVKHKLLPEVDEDFAADVGFDSVAELARIFALAWQTRRKRDRGEFREAALDAARPKPGRASRGARSGKGPRRCGIACCTRSPIAASRARFI